MKAWLFQAFFVYLILKLRIMSEEIKGIILSYCEGIEWLEFNIKDLDAMVKNIMEVIE